MDSVFYTETGEAVLRIETVLALFTLLYLCSCGIKNKTDCAKEPVLLNEAMEENFDLFHFFEDAFPDKEIVISLKGDFNSDGIADLLVVYRENAKENRMVGVYSDGNIHILSEPNPAPYEDVRLQWRDIDNRPPIELFISGRRGIHFGAGIFRFIDGRWINLFGGMEHCC